MGALRVTAEDDRTRGRSPFPVVGIRHRDRGGERDRALVLDLFAAGRPTHTDPRERQMSLRYVEVLQLFEGNHPRAIATLRSLVAGGLIEWTDNGVLYRPPRRPPSAREHWTHVHRIHPGGVST